VAPLITIEDAAALLPIRAGNTSQDAKLTMLINAASALIEQAISRELDKRQRVELFDSPNTYRSYYDFADVENQGGSYIDPRPVRYVLKAFNIDTNATIEVRYDPTYAFDDSTVVPATNYTVDATNGLLQLRYAMFEAKGSVKVTYTGGYTVNAEGNLSDSIPVEFKMACLAQVIHMFNKFTADNIGKNSDTTDSKQGNVPYATRMGLVPEALSLISRYKVVGVGNP
jgi:hypothetical protein